MIDLDRLKALRAEDYTVEEIAKMMKQTEHAIEKAIHENGLQKTTRYTPKADNLELWAKAMSWR